MTGGDPERPPAAGLAGGWPKRISQPTWWEFTELQGRWGDLRAAWKDRPNRSGVHWPAVPAAGVEASARRRPATTSAPNPAVWVALSLADKIDTPGRAVHRRRAADVRAIRSPAPQAHGVLRLPLRPACFVEVNRGPALETLVRKAASLLPALLPRRGVTPAPPGRPTRRRSRRVPCATVSVICSISGGFSYDEINAVVRPETAGWERLDPLDGARRSRPLARSAAPRLRAARRGLQARAKPGQGARGAPVEPSGPPDRARRRRWGRVPDARRAVRQALAARDYLAAFRLASGFRPRITGSSRGLCHGGGSGSCARQSGLSARVAGSTTCCSAWRRLGDRAARSGAGARSA